MVEAADEELQCGNCRSEVDLATGVKITIKSEGQKQTGALCEECAEVECDDCGGMTSIRTLLEGDIQLLAKSPLIVCDRCEAEWEARDAVEIRHPNDPQYRKRICGDCFKEITVPPDYEVLRDFPIEADDE